LRTTVYNMDAILTLNSGTGTNLYTLSILCVSMGAGDTFRNTLYGNQFPVPIFTSLWRSRDVVIAKILIEQRVKWSVHFQRDVLRP
jgi:hypothetical protein